MITVYYVLVPIKESENLLEVAKFFNESDAIRHIKRLPVGSKIEAREELASAQDESHQATATSPSAWGQPLTKPGVAKA